MAALKKRSRARTISQKEVNYAQDVSVSYRSGFCILGVAEFFEPLNMLLVEAFYLLLFP